jgi:tetratricopeptide (TPR) repeat protein
MRMLTGWLAGMLLLLGASVALADASDDCDRGKDPDLNINGCTITISGGGKNTALAYNNRGVAYNEKRDYEHAIADFSKAIDLDAKLAVAYNNRGLAYHAKGDYERAIADFSKAIDLDPKNACTFTGRSPLRRARFDSSYRRPASRHRA